MIEELRFLWNLRDYIDSRIMKINEALYPRIPIRKRKHITDDLVTPTDNNLIITINKKD